MKDLNEFKKSVSDNKGYYIGRYEAGKEGETLVVKRGVKVWNNVKQYESANLARGMYTTDVVSDLVNSYAWDTAIVFIQEFSGDTDYARQTRLQDSLTRTGKAIDSDANKDVRCNIYDMAGNCCEWSTETSSADLNCPFVFRGGYYNYTRYYTSGRYCTDTSSAGDNHSFRPTLYW